ncbi:MAG: hypothetical protein QNK11_09845 [Legionella sp.]|nr:hypothetical protein [Legionella sp.]
MAKKFFDFNVLSEKRASLAVKRTKQDFNSAFEYAKNHKAQTVAAAAIVITAAVFAPQVVMLALCVAALLWAAFNLFKAPTRAENLQMSAKSVWSKL